MSAQKNPSDVGASEGANSRLGGPSQTSDGGSFFFDVNALELVETGYRWRGRRHPQGAPAAPGGLPCLNHNNSTERVETDRNGSPVNLGLTAAEKRAVFVLAENVKAFCARFGLERVGFLTLTFAENLTDFREAQRRFNSLATHVLREHFDGYVCVVECQKRGAIHYHLLVACREDIRTGFDFEGIERRDYRSASPALRSMWGLLRGVMPAYGFGRSELLPVKTTAGGMANYCGKYLGKAVAYRHEEMGGARLVRYSQGTWRAATSRFAWASEKSANWREALRKFGAANGCQDYGELQSRFGKRWAWHLLQAMERREIVNLHLVDEATARDMGNEVWFRSGRKRWA